jgi:hypothetical protein
MKKIFLIVYLLCSLNVAVAQEKDKPFRWEIGGGSGILYETIEYFGCLIYIEPKYSVMKQLNLGLKMDAAYYLAIYNGVWWYQYISALLTSDYFFDDNSKRHFIGAGFGQNRTSERKNNFCYMLRTGIEVRSLFRFSLSYTLIDDKQNYYDYSGDIVKKNTYVFHNLSFNFGYLF